MFYLLTEENKATAENRLTANLNRDWLLPNTKWFYYSKIGYDWDRFKDWDYRIRTSGGPGYEFVNNEKLKILGRFGPSTYHTVGDENNTTVMEADFGVEMMWKIRDKHTLGLINDFYPSISDKGNYRNVTNLDWKMDLNFHRDLSVKFGVYNELDSTEDERYDFKYNISLVIGL